MALPDADRALRAARRAVRGGQVRAAGSGWCASTASSSTRSSPARASATTSDRAVGHLRRPRRAERVDDPQRRAGRRGALAVEGDRGSARRRATRSRSPCRTRPATATRSSAIPRLVLSDVLDGFTTVELAERDYGVVIDPGVARDRRRGDGAAAERPNGRARLSHVRGTDPVTRLPQAWYAEPGGRAPSRSAAPARTDYRGLSLGLVRNGQAAGASADAGFESSATAPSWSSMRWSAIAISGGSCVATTTETLRSSTRRRSRVMIIFARFESS